MKDWVINLTVVLSDGTVMKTKRRPRYVSLQDRKGASNFDLTPTGYSKSSAGYNLNALFVGSEGTLGLVTEATLKLANIPEATGVAVIAFPTIKGAASMAVDVIHKGVRVGAVEILDDVLMGVINKIGNTSRTWKEAPTLFFKFSGTKAGVKDSFDQIRRIADNYDTLELQYENGIEEQKALWSARKEALWSMLALRESGNEVWSTDVAVPLSRVSELIGEAHRGSRLHMIDSKIY